MNESPIVSIIVPFFNADKYFEEAIQSVFSQTYKDWELLLVDDGSSDRSTEIALNYRNKFQQKVRYLEHNQHINKGISASRNLGIKHAKGKYLAMLDADDKWVENKLEQQVEIMEAYPEASMVYGVTKYWYGWTNNQSDRVRDYMKELNSPLDFLYKSPKLLTRILKSTTTFPSISNVMFRRDAVQRVNGFEENFNNNFDSQTLLAKMYSNYDTFIANCCWDWKRQYQVSTQDSKATNIQDPITDPNYLGWLEKYLSLNEINDPDLLHALDKNKWIYKHPILSIISTHINNRIAGIKLKARSAALHMLPNSIRYHISSKLRKDRYRPPLGWVHFGELRRLKPISHEWGLDRGTPIDRYYIESFLNTYSNDIQGNVVEVGGDIYIKKYDNDSITKRDILCLVKGEVPNTTLAADLTNAPQIQSESFDCIIILQTLQLIYNIHSVIDTLFRILKPGGVVLATVAGISQTTDDEPWDRNWCWGFTSLSARKLFEEKFPPENVYVAGYGNVLVAASFLYGLAKEDLTQEELDYQDSRYEITISVRAVKPG